MPTMVDWILHKRAGWELSPTTIRNMIENYTNGQIHDEQMAAMLMAIWFRGLTATETAALTVAMAASSTTIDAAALPPGTVDKHSTGGIGDKTTLVVAPLVAAAGVPVAKLSGRGLGHTGGTLDKLAAIPGLTTDLPLPRLLQQVQRIGLAIGGQTADLVPADKRMYALRDATGTIDSIPLIASSIMSKKLATGARHIVLDVKTGRGAFMPDIASARQLAAAMVNIGEHLGLVVSAFITNMDRPLGRAVGNALEVAEALATLAGHGPPDLTELSLTLAAEMVALSKGISPTAATEQLTVLLEQGRALAKLAEMIAAQGGDPRVVRQPMLLPRAPVVRPVPAPATGWLAAIDPLAIGKAALDLGAGRRHKNDTVDPRTGIMLAAQVGDAIDAGQPAAWVHAANTTAAQSVADRLATAFTIVPERPTVAPLILDRLAGSASAGPTGRPG